MPFFKINSLKLIIRLFDPNLTPQSRGLKIDYQFIFIENKMIVLNSQKKCQA